MYNGNIKKCNDCGETKPVTDFGKEAKCPDGLRPYCRSCVRIRNKRTGANRDAAKDRAYRTANKERVAQWNRDWRAANPERAREIGSAWRARKLEATVEDVRECVVLTTHGHCNRSKKDRQLHELDLPFVPPRLLAVF